MDKQMDKQMDSWMDSQPSTVMSLGMLQEMHVNINRQPNKYTNPVQPDIHIHKQTDSLIS